MNKSDFLDAICGKPVKVTIQGLNVVIKSITVAEMIQLNQRFANDEINLALHAMVYGLVEPKFTEDELEILKQGHPGIILEISKEILKLSGLVEPDESPTVGKA